MASLPKIPRAITVPETLVVICVIAIVLMLLSPPATLHPGPPSRTQAKNDVVQLAVAIDSYFREYGQLPGAKIGNINSAELMNLLAGEDQNGRNPRRIVFLEVPRTKDGKNGAEIDKRTRRIVSDYKDPWGNPYEIRVDDDYDGDVQWAGGDVRKPVIVWSRGNPKKRETYEDTNRWIKSWE